MPLSMSDFGPADDDVVEGSDYPGTIPPGIDEQVAGTLAVDPSVDPTFAASNDPAEPQDHGALPGDPETIAATSPADPFQAHRAETARLDSLAGFVGRFVPHPGHTYRLGTNGDAVMPADNRVPQEIIDLRWRAVGEALAAIIVIAGRSSNPPQVNP